MSTLFVYHVSSPELPNKVLTHFEDIASTLAEHGVAFDRLHASSPVTAGASHDEVVSAYRVQIDELMTARGYAAVDVISLDGHHPQKDKLQPRLMDEHRHGTDEVRFFVAGRGLLSLHLDEFVYAVLCEKNDLICLPAGTRQWLDMGDNPRLVAIRLFKEAEGLSAHSTGDTIAGRFPRLDD